MIKTQYTNCTEILQREYRAKEGRIPLEMGAYVIEAVCNADNVSKILSEFLPSWLRTQTIHSVCFHVISPTGGLRILSLR